MIHINVFIGKLTEKLATFLGGVDELYPSKNGFPDWMPPILEPIPYTKKIIKDNSIKFNITENVCGLTVNLGLIKRGIFYNVVAYDKNGNQVPYVLKQYPKIHNMLVDIQHYYNANEIILQAKILEKDNYYNIMPKILAFCLYIDGIEQTLKDTMELLREHNIEMVPVLDLDKTINENTKENYSAQSMLANVPSKGIICTNRQKSLSFLL